MHPFYKTLGAGPYKFVGVVEIKKTERGTLLSDPELAKAVKAGVGTCAHCGTAIMNCFIVKNAAGELYGVGSDCIAKTCKSYDPDLNNDANLEKKKVDKRKRAARKAILDERKRVERVKNREALQRLMGENKEALVKIPHPSNIEGKSFYDYLTFCFRNFGDNKVKELIDEISNL